MDKTSHSSPILGEMMRRASAKKSFIMESIEEMMTNLTIEYNGIVTQKDLELAFLKDKNDGLEKDLKALNSMKNELVHSVESLSSSQRKTAELLSMKDEELGILKAEYEAIKQKYHEEDLKLRETSDELIKKMAQIQEYMDKMASQTSEIIELKEKLGKLKVFVEKGGMAYAASMK